jgi:hypothetical protein
MLWGSGAEERPGLRSLRSGNIFPSGKGGVTARRPIYDPDLEYSDAARRAKHQGAVLLRLVVRAERASTQYSRAAFVWHGSG